MILDEFLKTTKIDNEYLERILNTNEAKFNDDYIIYVASDFNKKIREIQNILFDIVKTEQIIEIFKDYLNVGIILESNDNSIKLNFIKKIITYNGLDKIDVFDYVEISLFDNKPFCIMYSKLWYPIMLKDKISKLKQLYDGEQINLMLNPNIKQNYLFYKNNILVLSSVCIHSVFGLQYETMLFDYSNNNKKILLQERFNLQEEIIEFHNQLLLELKYVLSALENYFKAGD